MLSALHVLGPPCLGSTPFSVWPKSVSSAILTSLWTFFPSRSFPLETCFCVYHVGDDNRQKTGSEPPERASFGWCGERLLTEQQAYGAEVMRVGHVGWIQSWSLGQACFGPVVATQRFPPTWGVGPGSLLSTDLEGKIHSGFSRPGS